MKYAIPVKSRRTYRQSAVALMLGFYLVVACIASGVSDEAEAGWLVAPGVKWGNFSLRPVDSEPTPNYYGYGFGLSLGYSARQILDVGGFLHYIPGSLKAAKMGQEDCQFVFYGPEIALRIGEAVYIAVRGGPARYQLLHSTVDTEVGGKWAGYGGGMSLGAIYKAKKRHYWQISFDFMSAALERTNETYDGMRRVDAFSFNITYVFNSFHNYLIANTLFSDFLDSFSFF